MRPVSKPSPPPVGDAHSLPSRESLRALLPDVAYVLAIPLDGGPEPLLEANLGGPPRPRELGDVEKLLWAPIGFRGVPVSLPSETDGAGHDRGDLPDSDIAACADIDLIRAV